MSAEENEPVGFLGSKVVMVTGAGGSIGSELARQVARFAPSRLGARFATRYVAVRFGNVLGSAGSDAKRMIELSGYRRSGEIDILFTGVRPGQKLFEELQYGGEAIDKTRHPKIFVGKIAGVPASELSAVCGMLNQQGGVVLWGVDARGRVVGVEDAARQAEELNAFLMQHMSPRPLLSVTVVREDEKSAVVVDVPPGADKPYSIRRQIWVRLGQRTLRADGEAGASLVERSAAQLDRWEREPMPGFGIADCDAKELARARGEIESSGRFGIDVPATDEDLLRSLYVWRNGQLTNGAVVLFAQSPRAWAPNLGLRIVSVPGDGSGPMGNDTVLEGPAVKVLREAIDVIRQRTGYSARLEKGKLERKEHPAYALPALREGLVNAIAHRDYAAIGGDIRVEILPESLVIRNPGRLPTGWTPGTLKKPHARTWSTLTSPACSICSG